ncbi:hypothetical protein LWC34_12535 [Kibdelosporangium philippinense]|uniref:AMP-binding enzyme C-terminal domain-containing protein n=1 Tax=Kibdelosporangium philippinense TaxID=211113 RepID=A0ABS8Z6Y4_9PSEU|nr:hypothetical protein [Kibdelosporangium philippinense]MCE7003646.1 hypothetical protein [Kibdelosporangium philippinense]
MDNQIKIRGYRVELGEIEAAIRKHPAVADVVVVASPRTGDTELVALYTGEPVTTGELTRLLREHLPIYMVPHRYQHQDSFPLNVNGKFDRLALSRQA